MSQSKLANSLLTENDVREIKRLFDEYIKAGPKRTKTAFRKQVAKQYGVAFITIRRITEGTAYTFAFDND